MKNKLNKEKQNQAQKMGLAMYEPLMKAITELSKKHEARIKKEKGEK